MDETLTHAGLQRSSGAAFGVRITRLLNDRFAVEGNVEYAHDRLGIDPSAVAAIEATKESFYTTWTSFFSAWKSSSPVRSFSVTASSEIANEKAGQTLVTGNLSIALKKQSRTVPYLVAGGGVVINARGRPGAELVGAYSSTSPGIITDRDHVQLRFDTDSYAPVGIAGGGIKYYLTSRWGLRLEARLQFAPNRTETIVSAMPGGVGRCLPCLSNPGPAVVFGDSPSIQMGGFTTTASLGGTVADFQTYRSTGGTQFTFGLTAGILRRF